jgi:3-isopropylmalate/(R)-2-methylmalate dehydratase small subunit
MDKFTVLTGQAAPLLRPNIDTDIIIRIDRLAALRRAELGGYAFEAWRFRPDGSEEPEFILNQAPYRHSAILLAGANFGCGSSREHAVWALQGIGLRCVIAPSYGEIFFGNCFQNGVLPVVLPAETVAGIAAEVASSPSMPMTVDLEQQLVISPDGARHHFDIEPARRVQLLEGLDEIALTLRGAEAIDRFQAADRAVRPWIYQTQGVTVNARQ